jgi:hypothetical protein
MGTAMDELPPLDEIGKPPQAWVRYQRLMRFMMTIALLMVGASFVAIFRHGGIDKARFYVATALGLGFVMLSMSALMGVIMLTGGKPSGVATQAIADDDEDEDQSAG